MHWLAIRNRVVGIFFFGVFFMFPPNSGVFAQDKEAVIRKGQYSGIRHGQKTKFSIQEIHNNNTFDGVAEFTDGPFAGTKFGFTGRVGKDNALVITRYVAGGQQVAEVEPPKLIDKEWVWRGETTGIEIPERGPPRELVALSVKSKALLASLKDKLAVTVYVLLSQNPMVNHDLKNLLDSCQAAAPKMQR